MTNSLLDTLNRLVTDKSVVVNLYKQLFEAEFIALVQKGTESDIHRMAFLTYYISDDFRELPIFTENKFVVSELDHESVPVRLSKSSLWNRLLDIIETGKCEVAINPGQHHAIRINKEMILGMISMYGAESN